MSTPTPSADDRVEPPLAADEAATVLAFLDYQRATLRWKCAGLDAARLDTALPTSSLTLGGLLKHLAVVEAGWLNLCFAGGLERPSWLHEVDPDDDDWSFTTARGASPEQLTAWLDESIAVSRRVVEAALATPEGLDAVAVDERHGTRPTLRWILLHLIEEYARHNGHADLLREAIDGSRGE